MKAKSYIQLLVFVGLAFTVTSCEKDYLDKTPDEDLSLDDVFANRNYTEQFLNNIYSNLPEEGSFNENWARNPFVCAADEMKITWTYPFAQQMNAGAWNPVNTPTNIWDASYQGVRKANLFLERIDGASFDANLKQRWKGEAYFLRAFYHFWLLRTYGPIPLLDVSVSTDADFKQFVRRPIGECVDFIAADCDKAAELLQLRLTTDMYGHATAAAALALKSRLLLYAASPLWNGNADYAKMQNPDGTQLIPATYDESKWQAAATAAQAAITAASGAGYKLFKDPSGNPVLNYQNVFLETWNDEVLFARNQGNWDFLERLTTPTSLGGWSGYCPTQGLVDAYEMRNGERPILGYNADGSPIINAASGYVESGYATEDGPSGTWLAGQRNMYVNRDPRFYASINYNGQVWRETTLRFYLTGADGKGKGGPDFSVSGYTMKKMSGPTVNIPQGRWIPNTWIFFRLGELYLNLAEAMNEAQGPVAQVYEYVNAIRDRSGMPALPADLSKDEMRERIRHERRVEFAFETHRYFDTHRWKIAEQTDNGQVYGMNINAGTSLQDDSYYQRIVIDNRVFIAPKHYLWPMPQNERDINPDLVQNEGW
ncbi:RagB/SusD family nutrient uptake outer membrane protein [Parapedobacter sp. 2B3]|uniref:RagB/SusD family nutrient uptake outer membrane protein n=1 Tax=Parapedobacter sp. 2B3 TaxID=3342381 RepID=UPI0035B662BD